MVIRSRAQSAAIDMRGGLHCAQQRHVHCPPPCISDLAVATGRQRIGVARMNTRFFLRNAPASLALLAVLCAWQVPVRAQTFVNLDFEQAQIPADPDLPGFLSWEQGAPGWSHSAGDDTDYIILGQGHLGFSQMYVLMNGTELFGPEGGAYSMGMRSGFLRQHGPHDEWVQAFLAQQGTIPVGTSELRLQATSFQFQVQIDGLPITMTPIGLRPELRNFPPALESYRGPWSGDVSSFAGKSVELRIVDAPSQGLGMPIAFDNIIFLPVPEPATTWLLIAGLLTVILRASSRAVSLTRR
jgi:hypothetical protein